MNLSVKEFEDHLFKKEISLEADLKHKVFIRSTFDHCDFTKSNFSHCKFLECKMTGSNFSLVNLEGARLQDCAFENCKLVGVNFAKCEKMFLSLKFKNCLIETCNFSDLDLKGILFLTAKYGIRFLPKQISWRVYSLGQTCKAVCSTTQILERPTFKELLITRSIP